MPCHCRGLNRQGDNFCAAAFGDNAHSADNTDNYNTDNYNYNTDTAHSTIATTEHKAKYDRALLAGLRNKPPSHAKLGRDTKP